MSNGGYGYYPQGSPKFQGNTPQQSWFSWLGQPPPPPPPPNFSGNINENLGNSFHLSDTNNQNQRYLDYPKASGSKTNEAPTHSSLAHNHPNARQSSYQNEPKNQSLYFDNSHHNNYNHINDYNSKVNSDNSARYSDYSKILGLKPSETPVYNSLAHNHPNARPNLYQNEPKNQSFYFDNSHHNSFNNMNDYKSKTNSENSTGSNLTNGRPFYSRNNNYDYNKYSNKQPYWNRPYRNYKRQRENSESQEPRTKTQKKRKKPLSQNNPSRKDWTYKDVIQALAVEKELNKKYRNHSLIIKFPDHELNKEIVASFHPSIENVHFQQPSTPRFCFVTLKEGTDVDSVIAELNKQKFGEGFLTAESKKEREDEQSNNPEDIDPLALYVGNLAQEITKDDMVNLYPRSKRIDIGYAKKMKFTRYAFVRFRTAADAVEAFRNTHNKQMYNKSLIVRFRRLNGPVGMPGEAKPHNSSKDVVHIDISGDTEQDYKAENDPKIEDDKSDIKQGVLLLNKSNHNSDFWDSPAPDGTPFRPISVKKEPSNDSDEYDESESKPIVREFVTPFAAGSLDDLFAHLRPIQIKSEVKKEPDCFGESSDDSMNNSSRGKIVEGESNQSPLLTEVKKEVPDDLQIKAEKISNEAKQTHTSEDLENDEDYDIDALLNVTNFGAAYKSIINVGKQVNSLNETRPT